MINPDGWPARGLAMTQHLKLYRVVAQPYTPPAAAAGTFVRLNHVVGAERDLRAQLAASDRPDVLLVASERGDPAVIGPGGEISDVFAWSQSTRPFDDAIVTAWLMSNHAAAQLEVTDSAPDPVSPDYAAGGSILVNAGRIQHLLVASWLAPVAEQLADRYGVRVDVDPADELPEAKLEQRALVIPDMIPPDVTTALVDHYERTASTGAVADGFRPPRPHAALTGEWAPMLEQLILRAADELGAVANRYDCSVMGYTEGDRFAPHTDIVPKVYTTYDRTCAISLLLSEPGVDFTGGEFVIGDTTVDLHRGDMAAFTAIVEHGVQPITSGRRLVLVMFGEWRR